MTLEFPVHTIIFTIAPSNSGKSFFCTNYLLPILKDKYTDLNIQYLSTDDIRIDLLGCSEIHKHDAEMMQVSSQTFDYLFNRLNILTSFPVSADIIVVDSTAISERFRNDIIELAKNVNYNLVPLVFDYNDREDYFSYRDDKTMLSVINKHVESLKRDVLKTLKKGVYTDVLRIRTKDFNSLNIDVKISNIDVYRSHQLYNKSDKEYVIVSDIHGCLEEFKEIIYKNGSTIDENGIISGDKIFIVQDYVDKGYDILNTIRFIYHNVKAGTILPLIGNHENYVYKRLIGEVKASEVDEKFFNTVILFNEQSNNDVKEMFLEIMKVSKTFYRHKKFFVNHAPCDFKYLGKLDNNSLKKQRNFMYPKFDDTKSLEENIKTVEDALLPFVKHKNAIYNTKPVIWGHVAMREYKKFENIYMIDTGLVSGGKLTSICFPNDDTDNRFIKSVKYKNVSDTYKTEDDILNLFSDSKIEKNYSLDILEPEDRDRIKWFVRNKVNFISGTVCPADKVDNILEDLTQALYYYKGKSDKVILQPKYMGSRCNIYLNRDIEKTYCITRNGYNIRTDYKEALKPLYEIPYIKEQFKAGSEIIILDSEFMPWSAIGKGLIESEFLAVSTGINTEYDLLVNTGFEDQLNKLLKDSRLEEFKADISVLKKPQMIDKYDYRTYETLKNVIEYKDEHVSLADMSEYIKTYNRQMELYADITDTHIHFKPFSILKIVNQDGSEILFFDKSNIEIFSNISTDEYCIIDFSKDNWLETAKTFYDKITSNLEMEGVVIKPNKVYTKNVAPYLKCRNPKYLSIIYGYDYLKPNKYDKLIKRKKISQKLKNSITEFEIGKKMLEQRYDSISNQNKELLSLYIQMILDDKQTSKLDPRL